MSRVSISPVRSTVCSSATRFARVCHKSTMSSFIFIEWYIDETINQVFIVCVVLNPFAQFKLLFNICFQKQAFCLHLIPLVHNVRQLSFHRRQESREPNAGKNLISSGFILIDLRMNFLPFPAVNFPSS